MTNKTVALFCANMSRYCCIRNENIYKLWVTNERHRHIMSSVFT